MVKNEAMKTEAALEAKGAKAIELCLNSKYSGSDVVDDLEDNVWEDDSGADEDGQVDKNPKIGMLSGISIHTDVEDELKSTDNADFKLESAKLADTKEFLLDDL